MLQEILKSATKDNHDELEELMFVNEIMNKTITLQQYKTLLATNYVVHAAIESKLHDALDTELKDTLNLDNRLKLKALEQDLAEMEIDKDKFDSLDFDFLTQRTYDTAAALGAMYVLEGATLGGHVIQKKLRANPAFEKLNLNYYTVYAQNLMPNWLSFVEVLNTALPENDYPAAKDSAVNTFGDIARVSKTIKTVFA